MVEGIAAASELDRDIVAAIRANDCEGQIERDYSGPKNPIRLNDPEPPEHPGHAHLRERLLDRQKRLRAEYTKICKLQNLLNINSAARETADLIAELYL